MPSARGISKVIGMVAELKPTECAILEELINDAEYYDAGNAFESYCYFIYERGDHKKVAERVATKLDLKSGTIKVYKTITRLINKKWLIKVSSAAYAFNPAIFGHDDWREKDTFDVHISVKGDSDKLFINDIEI